MSFFYFKLKQYCKNNTHGRPFLHEADEQRVKFSTKIFKDAGQSDEQAKQSRRMKKMIFVGTLALKSGYDAYPLIPRNSKG